MDKGIIDPFVRISVHIPDWVKPSSSSSGSNGSNGTTSPIGNESRKRTTDPESLLATSPVDIDPNIISMLTSGDPSDPQLPNTQPARVISNRTSVIKNNGFNPVWEESLSITFDVVGDMKDLVFVRFTIRDEGDGGESRPIAVYCSSLGSLRQGNVSGIESLLERELNGTCRLSTPAIVRSAAFAVFILHPLRARRVEGCYIVVNVLSTGPLIGFLFRLFDGTIVLLHLDLEMDSRRTCSPWFVNLVRNS